MMNERELHDYYHSLRDAGRHYLASILRDYPELAPFTQQQEIIIELAKDNPHVHQAVSLWLTKTVTWEQAQGMMVIGLHASNKQFQELLEYHLRYSQPSPIRIARPENTVGEGLTTSETLRDTIHEMSSQVVPKIQFE